MICRGIGRVTLAEELKKVLDFLTINGYVNFGILNRVPTHFNLNYWTVRLFWLFPYVFIDYLLSFIRKHPRETDSSIFNIVRLSLYVGVALGTTRVASKIVTWTPFSLRNLLSRILRNGPHYTADEQFLIKPNFMTHVCKMFKSIWLSFSFMQGSVIVVGAGIAGIGAARQLTNAGCKVRNIYPKSLVVYTRQFYNHSCPSG